MIVGLKYNSTDNDPLVQLNILKLKMKNVTVIMDIDIDIEELLDLFTAPMNFTEILVCTVNFLINRTVHSRNLYEPTKYENH